MWESQPSYGSMHTASPEEESCSVVLLSHRSDFLVLLHDYYLYFSLSHLTLINIAKVCFGNFMQNTQLIQLLYLWLESIYVSHSVMSNSLQPHGL